MTAERIDLAAVLGKTALLSSLSQPELQTLAVRTVRKLFSAGELLFSEGEPCNGLHIIARGKVRIFKTSISGREQVLAANTPGESVAELPVFDGGPFPASAVATEETEIAYISRRDFQAYCMDHPEVALKVLQVVGARLRRLVGIIEELSFTTIRHRLISALLKLAQGEGKKTDHGIEFQLPASHQELANQLGTVRELISRNLMRLQAEGLLDVDARQIVVKDMNGLMFVPMAKLDGSDDMNVLEHSDVIVVTAGAKQKPGQTRVDLAEANTAICRKLIPDLMRVAPKATLLMVTNPVDVLTYVALKLSGLDSSQVLGSGTVLDSSRFRFLIAQRCAVAVQNVHAYIAGEHGESEIPLWSSASIGNVPVQGWSMPDRLAMSVQEEKDCGMRVAGCRSVPC